MEYMKMSTSPTIGRIMCCQCGALIEPNPANMCVGCLRAHVDITEGIPKQAVHYFCKSCERYQQAENQWIEAELESKELLALSLKKIKGLDKVKLVDASFIWTEPHSRRIKVKLTVQKEVMGGAILQQVFVVEFVVNTMMCADCHRREAKDFWRALVQVRQQTNHRKTFFYLEQLLLKHKAHANCTNIKTNHGGIDFYFDKKDDARKLVDFLMSVVPCRYQASQQLITHDVHNNTYTYKYTFSVEIVPICKDDVVCLPPPLAQSLGQLGQLCVVLRVTNNVFLIDPFTLRTAEMSSQAYWRHPFRAIGSVKNLTEYTIIDVDEDSTHHRGQSNRHKLADVWMVPTSKLGSDKDQVHTKTHLGHLLNPGDTVLAFDFKRANINEPNFDKLEENPTSAGRIPDAIIVKKSYGDRNKRHKRRIWKLRHMDLDEEYSNSSSKQRDLMDFMDDLEEDPHLRQSVNIYADKERLENRMAIDDEEEDAPQIGLQEMMQDLDIEEMPSSHQPPEQIQGSSVQDCTPTASGGTPLHETL